MTLFIDTRWTGTHGIGRYSEEVLSRLKLQYTPYPAKGMPLSARGQFSNALSIRVLNNNDTFYTPGFATPVFGNGVIVPTIHDLIHLHYKQESSAIKSAFYYLMRKKITNSPLIFTVSEFSKKEISTWLGQDFKGEIINTGNGLSGTFKKNLRKITPGQKPNKFSIYIPGSEKPHKNILRQIEACSTSQYKDQIQIYLTGIYSSAFKAKALKLHKNIEYLGFLSEPNLAKLYSKVDLVMFCSEYEGYGLPIIEAMSQNTPLLTSNVTSMPEIADGYGMLCSPYDLEHMANSLSENITDIRNRNINLPARTLPAWEEVVLKIEENLMKFIS